MKFSSVNYSTFRWLKWCFSPIVTRKLKGRGISPLQSRSSIFLHESSFPKKRFAALECLFFSNQFVLCSGFKTIFKPCSWFLPTGRFYCSFSLQTGITRSSIFGRHHHHWRKSIRGTIIITRSSSPFPVLNLSNIKRKKIKKTPFPLIKRWSYLHLNTDIINNLVIRIF